MGRKGIVRFFLWKTCCAATDCLNVLLALSAVLLTGLIVLNTLQKEVPLPDKLSAWAARRALGKEYDTVWKDAVFDLRGGLYLKNVQVLRKATGETVMDGRTLRMDWSLTHLVFGMDPVITEINASGMRVFIPSSHSPTGLNEPVIEVHQAHLFEQDGQLILQNLLMESRGIRLYATGSAPVEALAQPSQEDTGKHDWAQLLAQLRSLPDDLSADCRLYWTMQADGSHQLSIQAIADRLKLPGSELSAITAWADARITESQAHVSRFHGNATLSAIDPDSLPPFLAQKQPELPVRFAFSASGNPTKHARFTFPQRITLSLTNPYPDLFPAQRVLLESSLTRENPFLVFILKGPGLFASGTAISLNQDDAPDSPLPLPFSASFRAEFHQPHLHAFFPDLPRGRMLEGTQAAFLRFNARTNPAFASGFAGILVGDHLCIGQTRFAHIRADFSLDSEALDLTGIHVQKSNGEFASGSYFHHFPSSRFSLNALGSSFPASLDALLGPWWQKIFNHIHATKPLPADVTVWGHWNAPDALQSFTAVRGTGATYRGIAVPEMEVRVRSNRDWAYLEKLEAQFEGGSVRGQIGWAQGLENGELRPMVLDFRSEAQWEAVVAASGIPALGEMHFSGNPRVSAKGTVWQSPRNAEEPFFIPELRIALSNPGRNCRVADMELGGLSFAGTISGDRLDLNSVSGTFAEGVFTGKIEILDWDDPELERRHLDLQLFDASYPQALTQLSSLLENPEAVRSALLEDAEGGRVDTSFDLRIAPSLDLTYGSGRVTLRKAPLGQIHLFGGLSRFLHNLGLGFSTLELDAGVIEWRLEEGVLVLPECLITGRVLNLQASGNVNLATKSLDLRTDVTLFKGLVSMLLTPVSDNFQFDVQGTLQEPVWKLRLNPFRWFQNRIPSQE